MPAFWNLLTRKSLVPQEWVLCNMLWEHGLGLPFILHTGQSKPECLASWTPGWVSSPWLLTCSILWVIPGRVAQAKASPPRHQGPSAFQAWTCTHCLILPEPEMGPSAAACEETLKNSWP